MSPHARMRACYEKGVRPWRTYDTPTLGSVKHEMKSNKIAQDELLFYTWNRDTLEKLRKSNPVIMGKLDRILTLDMAGKLTR